MAEPKPNGASEPARKSRNRFSPMKWLRRLWHGAAVMLSWMVLAPLSMKSTFLALESEVAGTPEERTKGKTCSKESLEFLFKIGEDASKHTDEKVKQLLTLSAGLATLVLAFAHDLGSGYYVRGVVFVPLLIVVILCLSCFGVRIYWAPDPQPCDNAPAWCEDLYGCYCANDRLHDVRVEYYGAALRWFFIAITALCVVGIVYRDKLGGEKSSLIRIESGSTRVDVRASAGEVTRLKLLPALPDTARQR